MKRENGFQRASRRKFLGTVGAATAATIVIGAKPFLAGNESVAEGADGNNEAVWADLGHVLFNVKEFIYLR